jgi:hypothetical protein
MKENPCWKIVGDLGYERGFGEFSVKIFLFKLSKFSFSNLMKKN